MPFFTLRENVYEGENGVLKTLRLTVRKKIFIFEKNTSTYQHGILLTSYGSLENADIAIIKCNVLSISKRK